MTKQDFFSGTTTEEDADFFIKIITNKDAIIDIFFLKDGHAEGLGILCINGDTDGFFIICGSEGIDEMACFMNGNPSSDGL